MGIPKLPLGRISEPRERVQREVIGTCGRVSACTRNKMRMKYSKMHIWAKQRADCFVLVKLRVTAFPTVYKFLRANLIGVLYVKGIHSSPDTYNNDISLCVVNE